MRRTRGIPLLWQAYQLVLNRVVSFLPLTLLIGKNRYWKASRFVLWCWIVALTNVMEDEIAERYSMHEGDVTNMVLKCEPDNGKKNHTNKVREGEKIKTDRKEERLEEKTKIERQKRKRLPFNSYFRPHTQSPTP